MKSFLAAILVSAALASGASAATTYWDNPTDFANAVIAASGTLQTEDFTGETLRSINPPQDFGGFTTSLTSSVVGNIGVQDSFNVLRVGGTFNSTGMNGEHLHIGLADQETFSITFKSAVIAFGGLFAGVNNGLGGIRSEFLVDGVLSNWLGQTEENEVGGITRFFGFVSTTPFSTITVRGLALSEGFGIDNVQWASAPVPVPVPASGLLLMGAMVVAGLFGRRRARA